MECRCLWPTFKVNWLEIPAWISLACRIESEGIIAEQKLVVRGSKYAQWPRSVITPFPQSCQIAVAFEPSIIEDWEFGGG